jgi:hypothetical protein
VAADRLGLSLHGVIVDAPSAYLPALQSARQAGVDALLVASSPDFARDAAVIGKAATATGLPTVCEWDFMARDGCLIGYGPLNAELRRRNCPCPTTSPKSSMRPRWRGTMTRSCRDPDRTVREKAARVSAAPFQALTACDSQNPQNPRMGLLGASLRPSASFALPVPRPAAYHEEWLR